MTVQQQQQQSGLRQGLVVATHGRHCIVESPDGTRRLCHPRGKKSRAVVGDQVLWLPSQDEGTIEKILQRRNLFYRQDEVRSKSFAANLDQVLILLAAAPVFSESQLARALIAAEAAGIAPLVVLNKSDLAEPFALAWERLLPYRCMLDSAGSEEGCRVLSLSLAPCHAQAARATLVPRLQGKTTLVLGPSGCGKSTLINLLVPEARAAVGEISQALNSGKHTTTSTTWYWLDAGMDATHTTALIDSPGFQEFGLHHLTPSDLARCMPDIAAHAGACRFYNCTHLHEPSCAVRAQVADAAQAGSISASRWRIYGKLFAELGQVLRY